MSRLIPFAAAASLAIPGGVAAQPGQPAILFHQASQCAACHNGLTTPDGEDVSIGTSWRPSMMAHAARDPYWQAGVRREVTDHPLAQAAIENECSRCHMPMAHVITQLGDQPQALFANLALPGNVAADPLAVDGVSCALCHQIAGDNFGRRESFTGGFAVDTTTPIEQRRIFGPYDVAPGNASLMRSAVGFQPTAGKHVQQSELCATCHTLYTHALDANAKAIGELPEQVPYQEWLQSDFRETTSCQGCHMPVVAQPTAISSIIGEPREGLSRHDFRGANFLMLGILNRFRADLGVTAQPVEFDSAVMRTRAFLRDQAATVAIAGSERSGPRLEAEIVVRNLAGHKLPTAYPSRRVWLRVALRDAAGRVVFSSGEVQPTGAIAGNDNDLDGARFEPHYREIRSADQVQIYEVIMGAPDGAVTTGLLTAVSYLKDNRVPPAGFNKAVVPDEVKVRGEAADDPDFAGGEDRVQYSIDVSGAQGPFTLDAELWYQSIAYRWAQNLKAYDAAEPRRFTGYYESMALGAAMMLGRASVTAP